MFRKKRNVLVIDDDEALRTMIEEVAGCCNATVTIARDDKEALHILAKGSPFDGIFLDLRVVGARGAEVLDAIRRNRETADTPVFLLSSDGTLTKWDRTFPREGAVFINKATLTLTRFAPLLAQLLSGRCHSY